MEFKLFDKPDPAAGRPGDAAWYAEREVSDHINQEGMHRGRLLEAAGLIESHIQKIASIADWGAGNGGLLHTLGERGYESRWGYDLSPKAVEYARTIYEENVSLFDVVNDDDVLNDRPTAGICVVLTEFLEHLVSPHELLWKLQFARGERCRFIVASSPCNETPASFYEYHLWAWTGDSFAQMFERSGWRVLRHYARADVNTQFVLAERKG
jgi:2-polyprenyl-3-methyl-5-hydroxy-6-metoxy-1,4-benzoquinol methylase